jgi:hypothetical protein
MKIEPDSKILVDADLRLRYSDQGDGPSGPRRSSLFVTFAQIDLLFKLFNPFHARKR